MLKGDAYDNSITERIIGCAMEVHRELGPGLLESTYVAALCIELEIARLTVKRQIGIPLFYKGQLIGEHIPDLVVADRIVVEVKSIERFNPVHTAQVLTYLRVMKLKLGLLLNFNTDMMKNGIRRIML
jgi:GxxExxY protein